MTLCLTPFSSFGGPNGPTERGHKMSCLMEMDDHYRWRWTFIAHQHAVVVSWHAQKVVVCTDLAREVQDSGLT